MLPGNEYVEVRNGGYYVAGTRIGLDVLIHEYRRGKNPEDIFATYPSTGSLAKVYGALTFILEHPAEVDTYLTDQALILEHIQAQYPMSQDMTDRFKRAQGEATSRVA